MLITSISTFTFCILILITQRFSWSLSKKYVKNNILVDFIFFIAIVKVFFYMLLPTVLRTFSDFQFLRADNVELSDLILLYAVEYISWTVWLVSFVLIMLFFRVKTYHKHRNFEKIGYRLIILLAILYCWICINTILGIQNYINILFKAILHWISFGIGPFLLLFSLKNKSKVVFLLGLICTGFLLFFNGGRQLVFFTLIYMVFISLFILRKRKYNYTVLLLIFIVTSTFLFTVTVPRLNVLRDGELLGVGLTGKDKSAGRDAIEELEWRFGANTRMSTAFFNLYDRGEGAGINPIYHSLFGFIPRSIFPEKPHPSTVDGDNIRSQGMYIIYREIHGVNSASMVEFSTGAHSYWEFGLVGVIVLSIISGIYMALCVRFFSKLGLASIPLMYAVFKPTGYVEPKMWVSDIIMQIYQIIIPLTFLIVCIVLVDYTFRHGKKYLKYFLQPNCSIRQNELKLIVLCTNYYDKIVFNLRIIFKLLSNKYPFSPAK
jgi:hypothetical protein